MSELTFAPPVPLLQRHVEDFLRAMRELEPGWRQLPMLERAGAMVRAAARCGWTPGLAEAAVGDQLPAAVLQLGVRVDAVVGEALTIPKA